VSLKSISNLDVVVPGSVANLGGGFDTLGVAVDLYLRARIVDVRDDNGARLRVVHSTPQVHGQNAVESAFDALARRTGLRAPTVDVEVSSDIPMAAGLGSSAAATVAGLRIFERVTEPIVDAVLLGVATAVEGHADNAAPALFGGLNSVLQAEGLDPIALRWTWPDDLKLVVATPSVGLATAKARAALGPTVLRQDAIFNLQRVLSLVHALQAGDFERVHEAVKDRWHQPARAALVPLLDDALALDDADVLGAFLSGAGPSIAFLVHRETARVARMLEAMYERAGVGVTVRTLSAHQATGRLPASARSATAGPPKPGEGGKAAPTSVTVAPTSGMAAPTSRMAAAHGRTA
jgi:homoserine kinase